MKKALLCSLIIIIHISLPARNIQSNNSEIIVAPNATHIVQVTNSSVYVIAGSTYSFTVDTPEDKGLVSTKPNIKQLFQQLRSKDGSTQQYKIFTKNKVEKSDSAAIEDGDYLIVIAENGKTQKKYQLIGVHKAVSGQLRLQQKEITSNTTRDLMLYFTAGQRSPGATITFYLPAGINATLDNTTVNVIGRGDVKLKELATQSIGRVGSKYSYSKVGNVVITKSVNGSVITFKNIDLRPLNGVDLKLVISNVKLIKAGKYSFRAIYTTLKPEVLSSSGTGTETATLTVTNTVDDFERIAAKEFQYKESTDTYTQTRFRWSPFPVAAAIQLMQSLDKGKTWTTSSATIDAKKGIANISNLKPGQLYTFRLSVKEGSHKGFSNPAYFYSGKMDIKDFGVTGEDNTDNTDKINEAIDYLDKIGGGTLLFSKGVYSVRTVHLKSNVWLYVEKEALVKALKGADAPEATWFSDKKYRSGLSPTDTGPYADPENYMTKQDVGHHYFRNSMFFGERLDNVKIIGNGHITGNSNLVTGDNVMKNEPDKRADKMFVFKLCTNIEIGGIYRGEDLWYDAEKDEPYYIQKDGSKDSDINNMLHIDRAGHFVLLATGTDTINVHNTYFGKHNTSTARDIYDFMGCNYVTAFNIYSKVSSDDIIKPGSDCSLGFTRPASNYKVRNIIGDTNCNLFQIGSETADDIMDIHVDNIYILGANKAGFSISTNDGAHIKDIHLNCGHTGTIHSRSKMYRSFAPFFISISNRGRILGAEVGKYAFTDNGEKHNELLVKNVNIGVVENIILNGIDIYEVYAGSSHSGTRWKAYDGTQRRATPIIAGYSLPDNSVVEGGLDFKLPNGKHTGYIKNVVFNDVHVLVKGGNPLTDIEKTPPELGVGQYNASNLKVQPSYGIWARHVMGLTVKESSFNYEKRDSRYAIFLDDVTGAKISSVKMVKANDNDSVIKLKNSSAVSIENAVYYSDEWGNTPAGLSGINHANGNGIVSFPAKINQ